jgi:hypothetical protein
MAQDRKQKAMNDSMERANRGAGDHDRLPKGRTYQFGGMPAIQFVCDLLAALIAAFLLCDSGTWVCGARHVRPGDGTAAGAAGTHRAVELVRISHGVLRGTIAGSRRRFSGGGPGGCDNRARRLTLGPRGMWRKR